MRKQAISFRMTPLKLRYDTPQNCGVMRIRFAQNKIPIDLWGMTEGLTNGQKMEWAQLLYTEHQFTISEIAGKTGSTEAELRYWIQEGKWDGLKKSLIITKEEQLNILYEFLAFVTDKVKKEKTYDLKDLDKIQKLTAAIKNLESETNVAATIDAAKAFIDWLKEDEPDVVLEQTQRLNRYIKYLERKH